MDTEKKNLQQIMAHRLEKLEKIKEAGYNPYAYSYNKTHEAREVVSAGEENIGAHVNVAGRILSQRKMGKASFIHIQDMTGKIQIYLKNDLLPENIYDDIARNLDLGDIIGCSGEVFLTKTKELSIKANSLTLLAKNIRPLPNLKEKDGEVFNAFEDKELRYRHRQLDLIANPEVRDVFIKRSHIISLIRSYLDANKFLEVETPALQPVYGGASARPFKTYHNTLDQKLFLRIADELYLKRLIIGGFDKVYEIAKNFRNEGMDRKHNPEFTSLEFYEAYADLYKMMEFTESLLKNVANGVGSANIQYSSYEIDFNKPFHKKSMFDLLEEYMDVDMREMDLTQLQKIAKNKSFSLQPDLNYGQTLDKIFGEFVEPNLIEPIFVTDYPKAISPLAKESRDGDKNTVERFELFIAGMEIANSFSELNDPLEQRRRLENQVKLRELGDEEAHQLDTNYIEAMEVGMPPTGGVGIGIDRIVMLLLMQESIKDVIFFPALRQEE